MPGTVSIHFHPFPRQVRPRFLYLLHQFVVGLGHVVEGEDAPAGLEEQQAAEGDEGAEGELPAHFLLVRPGTVVREVGVGALCRRWRMELGHVRRGQRRLGSWSVAG